MTFIAGPFNATFDGYDIGSTQDGFRIEQSFSVQPIKGHVLADSTIDGIYRGGECFVTFTAQEWDLTAIKALTNFYNAGTWGRVGQPGVSMTSLAKNLILTRISATPNTGIVSLQALGCVLAPNSAFQHALEAGLRVLPFRLQLLPYVGPSSHAVWFTTVTA